MLVKGATSGQNLPTNRKFEYLYERIKTLSYKDEVLILLFEHIENLVTHKVILQVKRNCRYEVDVTYEKTLQKKYSDNKSNHTTMAKLRPGVIWNRLSKVEHHIGN